MYTTVAGEADASSTVQNPGLLGELRAWSIALDAAFFDANARRRGGGVGGFFAIPILRSVALGVGVQWHYLRQPELGVGDATLNFADLPYTKLSFAVSVPLQRWIRGLSIGASISPLVSRRNFWADQAVAFDVGISWRPHRIVALGVVARSLNMPRFVFDDTTGTGTDVEIRAPQVIDPELALRPLGTRNLELAIGARLSTFQTASARFNEFTAQPRGRLLFGGRGVRVFAEAERIAYLVNTERRDALRVNAGIELDLRRVGFAIAPSGALGSGQSFVNGAAGRLRISKERYESAVPLPTRVVPRIAMSRFRGDRGLWDFVESMDQLASSGSPTVLLELKGMSFGWAQVEEVRETILRYRASGGKVVAYVEGVELRPWFLATSTDRIIAHPQRSISIVGMSLRILYFGELLEKIGVKAEFVRIAEFKGTPEIYSRTGATDPVAAQRRMLLTDTWNHVLRLAANDRGLDPVALSNMIDNAPYPPERALALGLIDDTAWPDELDNALERWLSAPVRIEKLKAIKSHAADFGPMPAVAVLLIEGDIVAGPSFSLPALGISLAGSSTLSQQIAKLRKDPDIRAIVVRIDSRGGSVAGADAIARELDLAAKTKPVLISMGNVAASGGYWIATTGRYITVDATTQTGSIGIFYPKFDLTGLMNLVGVSADIESIGRHAAMRSWFKPYTDEERETAMRGITEQYEIFKQRVADARNIPLEEVDSRAGGRVWSGVRAIEVGLADRYGGLREAVERARVIAGIERGPRVVRVYPPPPTLLEQVRGLFGLSLTLPIGAKALAMPGRRGFGRYRAGDGLQEADSGAWTAFTPDVERVLTSGLSNIPASLWLSEGPEAMALSEVDVKIE